MGRDTIMIELTNEDGDMVEHELPAKHEVCHDCEGHGKVLNESMRNHCYTQEEFEESFDDESREQYFKRGGIYDVTCSTCQGKRVTLVIDEARLTPEQKELFELCEEGEERQVKWDRDDAFTRRMESGGY